MSTVHCIIGSCRTDRTDRATAGQASFLIGPYVAEIGRVPGANSQYQQGLMGFWHAPKTYSYVLRAQKCATSPDVSIQSI